MSEEKCFCHLNGIAVKDATARKDIEAINKDIGIIQGKPSVLSAITTNSATPEIIMSGFSAYDDITLYIYIPPAEKTWNFYIYLYSEDENKSSHVALIPGITAEGLHIRFEAVKNSSYWKVSYVYGSKSSNVPHDIFTPIKTLFDANIITKIRLLSEWKDSSHVLFPKGTNIQLYGRVKE